MRPFDDLNEFTQSMSTEIAHDLLFKAEHGEALRGDDIERAFALAEDRINSYRSWLEGHTTTEEAAIEQESKDSMIDVPIAVRRIIASDRGERTV